MFDEPVIRAYPPTRIVIPVRDGASVPALSPTTQDDAAQLAELG